MDEGYLAGRRMGQRGSMNEVAEVVAVETVAVRVWRVVLP